MVGLRRGPAQTGPGQGQSGFELTSSTRSRGHMDRGQRPGCAGVLSRPHPFQPPVGSNVGPGCPRTPVSVGVVICVIPTWLKQLPDRALGPLPAPALTAGHTHPRGTNPRSSVQGGRWPRAPLRGLPPHRRSGSPADTLSPLACPQVLRPVWAVEMGRPQPSPRLRPLPAQALTCWPPAHRSPSLR